VHVDLRGGQTDAVGVGHRLEHVVDQPPDAIVDLANGPRHRVQARVGVSEDG
jgi:hypothetical protein